MQTFFDHAVMCGVNMVAKKAVSVDCLKTQGFWLAEDVLHPETCDNVYPAGFWVNAHDLDELKGYGIDYIIVE